MAGGGMIYRWRRFSRVAIKRHEMAVARFHFGAADIVAGNDVPGNKKFHVDGKR